jgi:hypothetical protein
MKRLTALLGLLGLSAACSPNNYPPSSPSAPLVPLRTTPTVAARAIAVGEEVTGTLEVHGATNVFELTAPTDGLLVARLNWSTTQGRLELWLADALSSQAPPPIVGQLTVTAGRKYRVMVADSAAWDYDNLFLPYVLTTSIR